MVLAIKSCQYVYRRVQSGYDSLASLFIFRPNNICVCVSGFLIASLSKFWRRIQLRVTLPSRGGSGSGVSGGGGGAFLDAAFVEDFFEPGVSFFWFFLDCLPGIGTGGAVGMIGAKLALV